MSKVSTQSWAQEKLFLGMPFGSYFRSLLIPFNILAFLILCVGIPITWIRFSQGLGAVTNLSDNNPWGLWIGIDVATGVALAAGGVHDRLRRPRSAPAQVSRHRPAGPADSHARIHVRGAGRLC